ncbi:hypothetical protein Poly30_54860 [Planctomycetes bacterium Poly30]|uniref:Uncharacterized protein n=1 Tax=Saltatorellus ferox TaxID=2528018 RepID=A0A518F0R5_9BACT|nr:hypothetical protein Poly30_54860 [Planctomycetes bacterium Poly30]
MKSLRISLACLAVATLAGGLSFLPENLWWSLPNAWDGALRIVCVTGLLGFAVAFMVSLDRQSLVKS